MTLTVYTVRFCGLGSFLYMQQSMMRICLYSLTQMNCCFRGNGTQFWASWKPQI